MYRSNAIPIKTSMAFFTKAEISVLPRQLARHGKTFSGHLIYSTVTIISNITPMNQASTRSHCIFTVHLSSKEPGSATVRHAKLHLVDLAGSERVAKTGVGGQLLTEAKYINLSLHYLEQVIIALSEKHRSHIPYRNSMMTSVLRDSLGGNCMTTMIATLSLEKRNVDESISTCRFAQRVALIKNEAVLNEEIDPKLMIIRLQKEIQELKDELAIVTGEQRTEALTEAELLHQILDILVNMLKKEKKKAQDALHLSSMNRSELRHGQSSPFPPGNPDGLKTLPLSAPTQALDSSTSPYRSSLLHRKTAAEKSTAEKRTENFLQYRRERRITTDVMKQCYSPQGRKESDVTEVTELARSITIAATEPCWKSRLRLTSKHLQRAPSGETPLKLRPGRSKVGMRYKKCYCRNSKEKGRVSISRSAKTLWSKTCHHSPSQHKGQLCFVYPVLHKVEKKCSKRSRKDILKPPFKNSWENTPLS
ncbi:hypothetical protein FD754_008898 [Muntiacus muntjak]|uniref:Kinesin-like protein n=1 Tax=Muntiacus muntjak TaxID=9888 RepID=A0A5N3WSD7_MUNMU|nr:hypothetical protein FD754_008898 [Muntiacus muntjak]